jgi:DNA helicase-2/ATP-dependent DNA helicase PcrA
MKELHLIHAKSRTIFGNTTYNRVSRFVDEIPDNLLDYVGESTSKSQDIKLSVGIVNPDTWKQRTAMFSQASEVDCENLEVGLRVIHKKFGKGTITSKVENDNDYMLEINFDDYGMKRLMASFAKLKTV